MVKTINKHKNYLTAASGTLLIVALLFNLGGFNGLQQSTLIVATIIAGVPIMIKAWQALRMRTFSIELLVTIAVIGALWIGEYVESAVVTFLFLFGAYLEARTLEKTRSSLKSLTDMAPEEAVVIRDGRTITLSVEAVVKGDRVVIRSGGKVPVDGKIVSGKASLNESAVTGESVPATKKLNDHIFSGTMVDTGYIEMITEKVGEETTFAKIIELVEEAQDSKTETEKFLDSFATIYTPAIVILSVIVYLLTRDLHLAITFLVVACPGALVIGAPVSSVAGIGNGAKHGVLVKGGEVMERLAKIDTLVFDKTGTLTKGKPEVTNIKSLSGWDTDELLQLVAQAETISEHHLGRTIVEEAKAKGIEVTEQPESGKVIKGNGISATVSGYKLVVGNRKLMESENIEINQEASIYAIEQEKAGNTAILAAVDGKLSGIFSIADQIREDALSALTEMRKNGIQKIVMLTGDNKHTAKQVSDRLGLDEYYAELLPEDKVAYVKNMKEKGHTLAMAGDGINDAPAIATADIGLAMGEGGTDVSMETADVVLMADKLMQFSHAYSLSKATIRNMKQNTYFAVGIVFVLLFGVLMRSVHLASGMFIHEASILIVILNAMRLTRFNRKHPAQKEQLQPAEV